MFIFFLIWISRRVKRTATKQRSVLPEAGGAWPLVGHLHQLGRSQPAHIALGNMAEKLWTNLHNLVGCASNNNSK